MILDVLAGICARDDVEIARDGAEAVERLRPEKSRAAAVPRDLPKLVLLDLKLPKRSGLEVLQALRSQPRWRSVPVVVLTSSKETPDVHAAYRLGANSYLVKPVGVADFQAVVRQLGVYWLNHNEVPT